MFCLQIVDEGGYFTEVNTANAMNVYPDNELLRMRT